VSQQAASERLVSTHWPEGDDVSRHEAIGDQPERAPALPDRTSESADRDYLILLSQGRVQVAGEIDGLLASHRMLTGEEVLP
jgi:hypothetical protein